MNFQIKFDYKGNKGTWLNLTREQGNRAKILMGTRELISPSEEGRPSDPQSLDWIIFYLVLVLDQLNQVYLKIIL